MAIARVQTPGLASGGTNATSTPSTFGSPVTAGNLLVAFASAGTTVGPTITFSSTGSPAWVKTAQAYESGASAMYALGYCLNAPGGTTTVTATLSASLTNRGLIIAEYSGVALAAALDKFTAGKSTAAVTNPTDDAMVTTADGELIVSLLIFRNATNPSSPGAGFSSIAADTALVCDLAAEDRIQASAGSIAPAFTVTGGSLASGIMSAAFKAAVVSTAPKAALRYRQLNPRAAESSASYA